MKFAQGCVIAGLFMACGTALAAESVSIDLTGVVIRNNVTQSRSSSPNQIDPANNYTVTFSPDTRVRGRGEGGFAIYILPTLLPNPVSLDQAVQTLTGDPTADFPETSEAPNPAGTHPFSMEPTVLDAVAESSGVTVTLHAVLAAQIGADNIASFNITNVTLISSSTIIRAGYLEFTAGSVTVTRHPITGPTCDSIDFNNDTSFFDPQDIEAFLSVYSEGPCIPSSATCNDIDFNNDTSVFDPCDINSFLVVYSEGPCTPCGT